MSRPSTSSHRILLGVTSDVSLTLMRGFPGFLATRGWDVHVVCSPGPLLDQLRGSAGVTVHELAMKRDPSPLSDIRALIGWLRLLRAVRPGVTSVGTPKAGLLGGIAGACAGVPRRFYQLRGLRLETSRGLQRRILRSAEWLALRCADRVLAVSPSLRDSVVALHLVAADKVEVPASGSSNGVDVERFSAARFSDGEVAGLREKLGLEPSTPVVGFVGRLTVDKGLGVLSSALDLLEQRGVRIQLVVVGAVDAPRDGDLVQRLRDRSTPVIETGHVADTAIFYRLMDILCLPTFREGFPNVVLEAAASGVPAITTDATGAIDSVVDGQTGVIVGVGSAEDLAQGLSRLAGDHELTKAMGRRAEQHVRKHFSNRIVWEALHQAYSTPPAPRPRRVSA